MVAFNSQPHTRLTVYFVRMGKTYTLSIHSLIRGWPTIVSLSSYIFIFQFTASYEADRGAGVFLPSLFIFQFTASYEADQFSSRQVAKRIALSIHSLIRGWPTRYCGKHYWQIFQFTASYEADPSIFLIFSIVSFLSIHSLIRGWPRKVLVKLLWFVFQFTASYEADRFILLYVS